MGGAATPVRFGVLGALEARRGQDLIALGGPKQRTVLAALLLEPGRVVSTDRLAELVWGPEPPDRYPATLQVYIYNLRKQLRVGVSESSTKGDELIEGRRPGYLINVADEHLDLTQFEQLVSSARSKRANRDAPAAANLFRVALSLWRGPALSDLASDGGAAGLGMALDEQRLAVLEECFDVELALGRHAQLTGELATAVATHPLRERLAGQLIVALYRNGRQADALAAYRTTADKLADELGIDPGPELRSLEQAVLRHDPALDIEPGRASEEDVSVTVHRSDRGIRGAALLLPNGMRRELGTRTWTLGRHPDCDVVVADAQSSRRHAQIVPTAGGYAAQDLGSTNGTRVNGAEITRVDLADGDEIMIGETVFTLTCTPDGDVQASVPE